MKFPKMASCGVVSPTTTPKLSAIPPGAMFFFSSSPSLPGRRLPTLMILPLGLLSDVCKHCANTGCLEVPPTGSIVRTEFGIIFIQPDVCNGCGYCVVSCPFGVIDKRRTSSAFKCTFSMTARRWASCQHAQPRPHAIHSIRSGSMNFVPAESDASKITAARLQRRAYL